MGWQKRSTRKIYDSMSEHGFMIRCWSGNIIGFKVKFKACSICSIANSLNVAGEEPDCKTNQEGASGGMEAGVALELCVALHDESRHSIFVEDIVSNDYSTMRAYLTHDDNSKFFPRITVPTFLTDPSHRIKVIFSPIFTLTKGATKNPRQCNKIDALG